MPSQRRSRSMRRTAMVRLCVALALSIPAAACAARGPSPESGSGLALEQVANGLDKPLYVTAPAGDSRLFVVEQPGRIRMVKNGHVVTRPFLDLTDRVRDGGERGLLGLAFHPRYASNGFLYVNYTNLQGDTHIERYTVSSDP